MVFVRVLCGVRLRCASSSEASWRDQMLEACRPLWWQWTCEDVAVCKFKWSIMKRSNAWSLPSIVVTMDLWRWVEERVTHSRVWGSNQLVFIESTQSRKVAMCKFKWSITKRSSAWSFPSIVVTMDLWRCAEEWLTHSELWGSNHLVFIEPMQSRKVVQLEGVKIVII